MSLCRIILAHHLRLDWPRPISLLGSGLSARVPMVGRRQPAAPDGVRAEGMVV
ncbi:MAG: hypothetical protein OZSIB_0413 [Candidatus Ozemobacter sibiricus]|uniref:Uncharacterized protein n=1 Tax=Candidatus Ozemobacter sibiricus TaxID=2268124 RepID=A0A367ZNY3_9BACT|nr:MAG: hypothetical protein OZSIB_0413 [Candidatus Ozemobacter sibiricus]